MNKLDMSKDLKPCPFCGSDKARIHTEHDSDGFGVFISVKCYECRASSGSKFVTETCPQTFQEVRDDWNTRSQLDSGEWVSVAADAIEKAAHNVSELISAKSGIAETPEALRILNHKLDVVLAFEAEARKLRKQPKETK